jgi:hypothetical protein
MLGNRRYLLALAVGVIFVVALGYLAFGHPKRAPENRTFTLSVTGSTMTPSRLVAYDGDTITIIVSADRVEEIHLHGYDFYFNTQPGAQMVKTFPADKEGAFTIEIEGSTLTNGTRLGELDVYPN